MNNIALTTLEQLSISYDIYFRQI